MNFIPPAPRRGDAAAEAGSLGPLLSAGGNAARWRPRSATLHRRSMLVLGLTDLALIAAVFAISALVLGAQGRGWQMFTAALLPTYLVIAARSGAFHSYSLANPFTAVANGCRSLLMAVGLLILVAFYLKSASMFPRLTITVGSALGVIALAMSRYAIIRNLPRLVGGNPFSVILIHDGDAALPPGEFSLVIHAQSFFDPDVHDVDSYDRLATSLAIADRVVIACPTERRLSWAHAMQGANVQAEIVIPEIEALRPLGLGPKGSASSLIVAAGPLSLLDRATKRAFDLTFSLAALVLLTPVLLAVALWIKLDSPGPILFKQWRIGRGNALFPMYKFRSMRTEASDPAADRLTTRDDDRVTRVGRLIRATSIDELPQLFHVLTGQMSIVGPRPHATGARAASKLYWEVDDRYWHRHAAKPGLTGLAQVRGYRGNTEVEEDLSNRLSSDLEYLVSWSIWRDLKIIFLTLGVVLHRNAF